MKSIRTYLSLVLLLTPAVLFALFLWVFRDADKLQLIDHPTIFPWQVWLIGIFGVIATLGGILDWRFHRDPLNMKIPPKERAAEAQALGLGGVPMFILMCLATLSATPFIYLIPILIVLIFTVVAISYDEFVFHKKRCGKLETRYHRMLVVGNGLAWMSWIHLIYYT